jgi:uncharacterized protein with HEPN domain
VLGEAAARTSDDLVHRHPEIPWRQPALLRNRIVHRYWSIDSGILLATASDQLPGFIAPLPFGKANDKGVIQDFCQ